MKLVEVPGQTTVGDAVAELKAEALLEAAEAQRVIAGTSATRDGRWEHESIADWLEDRALLLMAGFRDVPDADTEEAS